MRYDIVRWAGMLLLLGSCAIQAEHVAPAPNADLQRRAGAANEEYAGVDVRYDAMADNAGHQLRLIVTHPKGNAKPLPTVFLAGWLSCDSVEAAPKSNSPLAALFRTIAQTPQLAFARLEKAGVGDSQGDCASNDFDTELDAYRRAFKSLKHYDFVDTSKIFILGLSNGGGFAPLIAQGAPVRGYVVEGAWIKTWFEHMLEIERRRLALSGKSPAEVNTLMADEASLYVDYLIKGEAPAEIFKRRSELATLWDDQDFAHQYGRPIAFYQQLQKLNLAQAWSSVSVPTLALHGQFDWIMSRADHELIVAAVDKNAAGAAHFIEVPNMGHGFDSDQNMDQAFTGTGGPLDPKVAKTIVDWFVAHY